MFKYYFEIDCLYGVEIFFVGIDLVVGQKIDQDVQVYGDQVYDQGGVDVVLDFQVVIGQVGVDYCDVGVFQLVVQCVLWEDVDGQIDYYQQYDWQLYQGMWFVWFMWQVFGFGVKEYCQDEVQ